MNKSDLRIDWATHAAAKYACENWHYSGCIPKSKLIKLGAWESGKFVGCVIFGYGATSALGAPYGLTMRQCCELVRIALTKHESNVSRIVRIALLFLKQKCPGIRLVVSYADPSQGHSGGVYQAGNWVYAGKSAPTVCYRDPAGKLWHGRRASPTPNKQKQLVTNKWQKVVQDGKHRYLMPLDDEMRKQIEPLRKPCPKRVRSVDSDTTAVQAVEGGAIPTRTLTK